MKLKPCTRIVVVDCHGVAQEAHVRKPVGKRKFWYRIAQRYPGDRLRTSTGTAFLRDEGATWAHWGTDAAKALFVAAALS